MLNLPKEAQEGLKKLRMDINSLATKKEVKKVYKERSVAGLLRLMFGASVCVIVLYAGLVMVWDYTLLLDKLPLIVSLLIICIVGLGLLSGYKEERK